jgi:NAD(P)-dependent dehydrogenase (short-subunit alcohol dehydrogenase family)
MEAFKDKVVLITGASSGIGRATALRVAGLGARVALAARNEAALREVAAGVAEQGSRAVVVPTDVSDPEQCRRAVSTTVDALGRLDVLICAAGVSMRAAFAESSPTVMEHVFRVNFLGTMHTTHHAIPHVRRTRGSLVAVSSLTGKRGTPFYSVYGASKFAIQGLYESIRQELAADGVHVGLLAPGFVDTPLRDKVLGPDGQTWDSPPALPFRLWPLEKCVDRLVRLVARRQNEALLPAFVRPLLALDLLLAGRLGDRILSRRFAACEPVSRLE